MAPKRRSTDQPASVQSRKCVLALAVFAGVAVALAFAAAGWALWKTASRTDDVARLTKQVQTLSVQASRDAKQNTTALCALRRDLEVRVATSQAFLTDHPDGIPGISAKAIRDALANQRRTIDALSGIDCK